MGMRGRGRRHERWGGWDDGNGGGVYCSIRGDDSD